MKKWFKRKNYNISIYKMELQQFLKDNRTNDKEKITHTKIGDKELNIYGGSYHIPVEKENEFYNLYYNYVFKNKKQEYLTEKQYDKKNNKENNGVYGVICIDLDFHFSPDVEVRLHTNENIYTIINSYCNCLKKYFDFNNDDKFDIYVMEKSSVNMLDIKTKDGIHIIIGLCLERKYQIDLRDEIMKNKDILELIDDLPIINTIDKVFDDAISSGNANWQLYGSRKPGNKAYELTHYYSITYDNDDFIFEKFEDIKVDFELFKKLSIRNLNRPKIKLKENIDLCKIEKTNIPTGQSTTENNENLNNNQLTSYNELLSIIGNKGHSRNTWLILCSWFVNHSTKNEFINFVDEDWKDDAEKLFDNFSKNKKPCSKYALNNIAKSKDENAYIAWRRKHNVYISVDILTKGSNDVAKFIAPRLKQNLIYCNDLWFQFDKTSCLWRITKRPDAMVINHIQREIDETRESILYKKNRTDDEDEKKRLTLLEKYFVDCHREVSKGAYVSQTLKFLADYLFDADFEKMLDSQTEIIAFKNGILDLKTLNFRTGLLQSDFITKTIPYNYVTKNDDDEDVIAVRTALKKICNWNDSHLDYYLSCIGYALTGLSSREQNFWYLRGQTAENGKSVIFEALEKIMPNYVIKGTNTFLDKGAELKKEVPTWKGKRILWLNEVSTKMKDEDLVKAVCDGTDYKYNRNYAVEAEKIAILFKLFGVSNNTLSIKGDAGIARRYKHLQFNSQFQLDNTEDDFERLQFVRNKTFSDDLCGKWRDALLHLIFSYSNDYIVNNCLKPYPKEWNDEAKDTIADNNKFIEWFNDTFEIGKEFVCFKVDFENVLPNEFKSLKIKDELTRMKIKFTYESQKERKVDGVKKKGAFVGFRINEMNE